VVRSHTKKSGQKHSADFLYKVNMISALKH